MADDNQLNLEILNSYIGGKETQKQLAIRLGITQQAVSYRYNKLVKDLGLQKRGGTPTPYKQLSKSKDEKATNEWSYHALEFEATSYHRTQKYMQLLQKKEGRTDSVGEWRICFYKHKIIIFLLKNREFTSKTDNAAIIKANKSLNRLLNYIGYRYGFYILKDKKSNVILLKHHLAYRDAPEHDIVTEKQMFVQFTKDGEVVMQYDKSKGFKEREYVSQAVFHKDLIEPYIMDFLNQPLTNSQLTSRLNDVITALEKMKELIELKL